jgi:hypothetical protein
MKKMFIQNITYILIYIEALLLHDVRRTDNQRVRNAQKHVWINPSKTKRICFI